MTGRLTGCSVYQQQSETSADFYMLSSSCEWVGFVGRNSPRAEISLDNLAPDIKC